MIGLFVDLSTRGENVEKQGGDDVKNIRREYCERNEVFTADYKGSGWLKRQVPCTIRYLIKVRELVEVANIKVELLKLSDRSH